MSRRNAATPAADPPRSRTPRANRLPRTLAPLRERAASRASRMSRGGSRSPCPLADLARCPCPAGAMRRKHRSGSRFPLRGFRVPRRAGKPNACAGSPRTERHRSSWRFQPMKSPPRPRPWRSNSSGRLGNSSSTAPATLRIRNAARLHYRLLLTKLSRSKWRISDSRQKLLRPPPPGTPSSPRHAR